MTNPNRNIIVRAAQGLAGRVAGAVQALAGKNTIGTRGHWFARANTAGSVVTESTALTFTAFWRAVCFLSSTMAHLPIDVMRREGGKRVNLENDPIAYLLNVQANDELPAFSIRESEMAHVLTWGGGYAEIERTRNGDAVATHLLTPDRVMLDRTQANDLVYVVAGVRGPNIALDPIDVFHIRGLAFDGLVGYSPVALFRNAIGMGMSAEQYGASFFGNGAHPGGVLQTDKNFDERPETIERIRNSWAELHQGPKNAHRVAVLEDGLKWQGVGLPNTDAQFLENRKFQVTEMARIFNVPPFVVGDLERATNNNIEAQAIELVVYGLMPWVKRIETEADVKLLRRRETGRYCRMNLGALLRGDSVARSNFYNRMFQMGVFSPNDIRSLEDRDSIGPDGDVRLVPMNMVRLEDAGKATQAPRGGSVPEGDGVTPNQTLRTRELITENATDAVAQTIERFARKASIATQRHCRKPTAPAFSAWVDEFWAESTPGLAVDLTVHIQGLARAAFAGVLGTMGTESYGAEQVMGRWCEQYRRDRAAESVRAYQGGVDAVTLATTAWVNNAGAVAEELVAAVLAELGV